MAAEKSSRVERDTNGALHVVRRAATKEEPFGDFIELAPIPREAIDIIRRQHEMLKRVEWAGVTPIADVEGCMHYSGCPCCEMHQHAPGWIVGGVRQHRPDCALAALLAEVDDGLPPE